MEGVFFALQATAFPCLCTALGAASVFVVSGVQGPGSRRCMDGFAGGVMLAASIFGLLLPAVEMTGSSGWLAAGGGVLAGAGGLLIIDRLTRSCLEWQPGHGGRVILAIAIHNIPEGMVVGLAAATAAAGDGGELAGAAALALGIGLQNLPEGAAVSLPLYQSGKSRWSSFCWGTLSGLAEPLGGLLAALMAGLVAAWVPGLLCLAAGAMICVSVQELIPSATARLDGTLAFLLGFVVMMCLDIALG